MSSLNTLLEAARFLELQEQEQQHRANVEAAALAASMMGPLSPSPSSSSSSSSTSTSSSSASERSPERGVFPKATAAAAAVATPVLAQTVAVISSSSISSSVLAATAFQTAGVATPAAATPVATIPQVVKKLDQDGHVTSTTPAPRHHHNHHHHHHRILHNSFDIMNPVTVDDATGVSGGPACPQGGHSQSSRRKQPPMVFRAGTREVHNKLEKHRRAHLKECFDILKKQLPATQDEKKTSNLSILHSALRYIQTLKRKERELEHEMERLAREKISSQQRLAVLKKEISSHYDNVDFTKLLPDVVATPTPATVDVAAAPPDAHAQPLHHQFHQQSVKGGGDPTPPPSSQHNGEKMVPILAKGGNVAVGHGTAVKEVSQPAVQTTATALSVLPMTYPVNQGLVLQKVIVPKGIDGLAPLVSTHFITAPQQINGKVVPLTQYLVKPVVVVSTASPRPS